MPVECIFFQREGHPERISRGNPVIVFHHVKSNCGKRFLIPFLAGQESKMLVFEAGERVDYAYVSSFKYRL